MAEDRFAEGYAVGKDNSGNNYCYPPMFGNGGGFGGFGGEWGGIIGLVVVASLFGNGGFGFGGNRGNCATQADVRAAVDQQTLISKIDQQTYGLADTFNSLNNTLNSNFRGLDNAICSLGYNLSHQLSDCCCTTQRAIDSVRFENERNTCNIIQAINAGNQRLVDIYTADKLDALRAENTALKGRISDDYQADRIISRLSPNPSPAYIVPNPNCCYNYNVTGAGYNNGCGCGCG